ncbi:MAG: hypothetical protein IJO28_03240 [Oscillospiraceae bacterium]|nr:hypothetical protein [Oscillospiraceae bacterium]
MRTPIVYLKPGRRRPVSVDPPWGGDPQQVLPAAWCPECGAELYSLETVRCRRCAQAQKGSVQDEASAELSL